MTSEDFAGELSDISPQLRRLVEEHLAQYEGELVLHVLMSEVRRRSISAFYNFVDERETTAVLELVDEALLTGAEVLENAVAVSFVADACVWHPRMAAFLAAWPPGLRAEAKRQRSTL
jgi:hypothetical protein